MGDACEEWLICDLAAQSLAPLSTASIRPRRRQSQTRCATAARAVHRGEPEYVDKILSIADRLRR